MEDTPPAMFDHCLTVYEAMHEAASSDKDGNLIYEGFLTRLFQDTNLSIPYYTHVMRMIKSMDCARQLRRGGGASPSKWLLVQEPTLELYKATASMDDSLTQKSAAQSTEQRIRDLTRRLSDLEAELALVDEKATRALESRENDKDNVRAG